jgi:hypothetical protein
MERTRTVTDAPHATDAGGVVNLIRRRAITCLTPPSTAQAADLYRETAAVRHLARAILDEMEARRGNRRKS